MTENKELQALLAQNKELSANEGNGGVKADYILLAKPNCQAMKKTSDMYIEGLKIGDFYCKVGDKRVNLGDKIEVIPLAFLSLFQEKESTERDAQYFGIWSKEQALEYPMDEHYNRTLPNGHILMPVYWVVVEVIGHKEIERGVIVFKSTGGKIFRKWQNDSMSRADASAIQVYEVTEHTYQNDKYDWTDYGFEYKGSLLDKGLENEELIRIVVKSNDIRAAYLKGAFAPKRELLGSDSSQAEEEEEEVGF